MVSRISSQISNLQASQVSAEATAKTAFSNYSKSASGFLTQAQVDTLVKGGVAIAIANAKATFNNDAALSTLLTDVTGSSLGNNSQVKSSSESKVAASFSLAAKETFSFNFSADLALTIKGSENSGTGHNEAKSETAFLVLDTSNINQPKLLDYFDFSGDLQSPQNLKQLNISAHSHVKINNKNTQGNVDGSYDTESIASQVTGTYQRKFNSSTNITIVEINDSSLQLSGNTLNSSLQLSGNTLIGNQNNQDLLTGMNTNKVVLAESNQATFVVKKDDLLPGESDITNFDAGKDKIELQGFGITDASTFFNGIVSGHQLVDTDKGALLTLGSGESLLLQGVHVNQLSSSNFKLD
ncbi:MAG: hypothetical protein DSM106950_46160 [Stigonema ocellatum SAG 48.90 = DSM 106950]|nr:hypothetical protein [Stigonema ocellatum SAG 48.90 = DSM 106950]